LAILDEAMAWAAIAIVGHFAVTQETTSRFERPVKIGRDYTVAAWIDEVDGRIIHIGAEILRADGRRCVTATATFAALDLGQAGDAAGTEITGEAATYTVPDET
jgi:acyl-CoA thioesterase FadM